MYIHLRKYVFYFFCSFLLINGFLSAQEAGLLLSFDDSHNISNWTAAIPLFEKYNAKATFFLNRVDKLKDTDIANLKKLTDAGFALGFHGVNHVKSVDYISKNGTKLFIENEILPGHQLLENIGFSPMSFAYPMSQRNDESDSALRTFYPHARSGSGIPQGKHLAETDIFFTPVKDVPNRFVFTGTGCDRANQEFLENEIFPALKRAKERGEILTLYAHGITENSSKHHIQPAFLEEILKEASRLGLSFYTFDDMALWKIDGTTRIVSYNVRGCRGFDDNVGLNPELATGVLKKLKPDVAGLQEIDQKNGRSKMTDQIGILGSAAGMLPFFSKAIDFMGGEYGIGVLASEEPLAVKTLKLPGKEEARTLIELEFTNFVFFNTHLSLTAESREEASRIISEESKSYSKPVILVGDFNISDSSELEKLFETEWTILSPDKFTFPADNPIERIDYIMIKDPKGLIPANAPEWKEHVTNSGVFNVRASDHRPVFVDFNF